MIKKLTYKIKCRSFKYVDKVLGTCISIIY